MNVRRLFVWLRRGAASLWGRLFARLVAATQRSVAYSQPNMRLFALVAVIGHTVYYLFWAQLNPQPFESVWLRVFSMVVALPMLFEPYLSRSERLRRWVIPYWFFIFIYELPFFFVFMSLMNGFTEVWALSTMAACLFMVLLVVDWFMLLLLATVGSASAYLCFAMVSGSWWQHAGDAFTMLPIYFFALIGGSVFNYKTELVTREKLAAITSAVGTIAHELRTPLLGIRSGARGLQTYLPAIFEGFELARAHHLPVKHVRLAHYRQMHSVLDRIDAETEYTNVILDMLLINSSRTTIDESSFEVVRIGACLESALERYPFHSLRERAQVIWEKGSDFAFNGSQLLMIHVLFNLLKNALYFLAQNEGGEIRIWTERDTAGAHRLHFRDTGPGIHSDVLPRIFERFYSAMPQGYGTGIGLAFVRLVIESFGGYIRCYSVLGRYTEFVMSFPPIEDYESN